MKNDLLSQRRPAQREPLRITPGMVLAGLALVVVFYFIGLWVYNTYLVSDEEKIRGLVLSAARAAQERNPAGITATLSEDFVFSSNAVGLLDRDDCHRAFIQFLMQTYRHVQVRIAPEPVPVEVQPGRKTAEVTFRAWVQGKVADDSDWDPVEHVVGGTRYLLTAKLTENGWKFCNLRIEKEP